MSVSVKRKEIEMLPTFPVFVWWCRLVELPDINRKKGFNRDCPLRQKRDLPNRRLTVEPAAAVTKSMLLYVGE